MVETGTIHAIAKDTAQTKLKMNCKLSSALCITFSFRVNDNCYISHNNSVAWNPLLYLNISVERSHLSGGCINDLFAQCRERERVAPCLHTKVSQLSTATDLMCGKLGMPGYHGR